MLNILLCVYFAAALLNALILGGSMFWSLTGAAISLALFICRLFIKKKIKPSIMSTASVLILGILLYIGLASGLKTSEASYLFYDAKTAAIETHIKQNQIPKAKALLGELEKDFGATDRLLLYRAEVAMVGGDYKEAEGYLNSIGNKKSRQFFSLLGKLQMLNKDYINVQRTFIEAAKAYPDWSEAQRIAGIQSVNNKDYSIGEYFLLRAFEQVPVDPIPLYYIGVIRYEQGKYTEADEYFTEALELGPSDEYAGYIAWYRQEMGGDN